MKSNGYRTTWEKHNEMLGGRLQQVINTLQRMPRIVERNQRYLDMLTNRPQRVQPIAVTPEVRLEL
jgi:hypothetical protein